MLGEADSAFAGISRFERPQEGPADGGPSHVNISQRDAEAIRFFLYGRDTPLIGIGPATQDNRFARLGMKDCERFGAAREGTQQQRQFHRPA